MNINQKLKLVLDALKSIATSHEDNCGEDHDHACEMYDIAEKTIATLSAPTQEQPVGEVLSLEIDGSAVVGLYDNNLHIGGLLYAAPQAAQPVQEQTISWEDRCCKHPYEIDCIQQLHGKTK